ncbi:hypothetical protein DY000_02003553 [Brassica cretica]|uniref:Btz domain-containing protein n=1 Tax=Brassica cretica TaxID=69181 RepID=A0ABQ7CB70_BRACR|nr:hypothetical protein DY000_02003553 [Brassica cretica]
MDSYGRNVWSRLDRSFDTQHPRDRERFHPYSGGKEDSRWNRRDYEMHESRSKDKTTREKDSLSSSEWRVKDRSPRSKGYSRGGKRDLQLPRSHRVSPDSQRTISEVNRYKQEAELSKRTLRENRAPRYLPSDNRMQWQPVCSPRERREVLTATPERVEETQETDEERIRRIKGKGIARDEEITDEPRAQDINQTLVSNSKSKTISTIPENQVYLETDEASHQQRDRHARLPRKSPEGTSHTEREKGEKEQHIPMEPEKEKEIYRVEDAILLTEEEMNKIAEDYVDMGIEMNEGMLDEDDLLDEMDALADNTTTNTKDLQTGHSKQHEQQQAKVTSSTHENQSLMAGKMEKTQKQKEKGNNVIKKQGNHQKQPSSKHMAITPTIGKRRGTHSPDSKGLAASKKLATRGRASPKGKLIKHSRHGIGKNSSLNNVPRTEVYPSSTKGRKSSSALGLVGFQNPPSTQI